MPAPRQWAAVRVSTGAPQFRAVFTSESLTVHRGFAAHAWGADYDRVDTSLAALYTRPRPHRPGGDASRHASAER